MKNFTKNHFFVGAFIAAIIFLSAANSFGQVKTGGYKNVSVDDANVIEAAEFAVTAQIEKAKTEIELDEILKAERQTVAGTNFRLCLRLIVVGDEDEPYEQFASVVVFQSLKKEWELKSWAEVEGCQ